MPVARTVPAVARRRVAPLSPRPGAVRGVSRWCGAGWSWNQASQQKLNAQLTRGLVAADRGVGADLEVGPAQLVFDLFVALLDPVADRVDAHDLGQARGRVGAVRLARAARA